jgi:hypothetical protein
VLVALQFVGCTSSNSVGAPSPVVACNDGTGSVDCCPPGTASGVACVQSVQCWTQCNRGLHSQFYCGGGTWIAGHGAFPCGDSGVAGAESDGGAVLDGSTEAGQCQWPNIFEDAGAGVRPCRVGTAFVNCTSPSGGCGCISDDPASCPGCSSASGFTCQNACASNQYAVECSGPPLFQGSPYNSDQDPPDACVFAAAIPSGAVFSCCPCE